MPASFSIIIATRNRQEPLRRCLASLAELRFPHDRHEVIVVDDGSDYDVRALISAFSGACPVKCFRQSNQGPAAARNRGLHEAAHEFVAFLDDDCRPHPDWLARLSHAADAAPGAALGGLVINALTNNPFSAASQLLVDYLYEYYHVRDGGGFFTSNNLAFRKDLLSELNGFDAGYSRTAEDRDICFRWRKCGRPLQWVPNAVVYHEHHLTARSFWRQHFTYGRGARRFWKVRSSERGGRLRIEPLHFYRGLLLYPFRRWRGLEAIRGAALMLTSQIANASGFLWETWR